MRLLVCLPLLLYSMMTCSFEYVNKQGKKREMPDFHHVLDVKLMDGMQPPKSFELDQDGYLQCVTCHGIEDIFELSDRQIDKNDSQFLRGGPYRKITGFCYNCHQEKENTRKNIHILLDEKGEIIEQKCKFCHEEVLDRDKAKKLDQVKLRQPPEIICYGCHLKTPHLNALEHMVELKDEKLEQWKLTVKEKDIYMPISDDGKVMCITCHTPHQKGVLDKALPAAKQVADADLDKGVSYIQHPWAQVYTADKKLRLDELNKKMGTDFDLQYKRIETEVLLRQPAKYGELCLSCHTFEY